MFQNAEFFGFQKGKEIRRHTYQILHITLQNNLKSTTLLLMQQNVCIFKLSGIKTFNIDSHQFRSDFKNNFFFKSRSLEVSGFQNC